VEQKKSPIPMIVLTGGPGAGKTAVLEVARKSLSAQVAVLPEAASIVFGGGFWRLPSHNAQQSAQRAIYFVQRELENLVSHEGQWQAALCDRGTLDGFAYWRDEEKDFWKMLGHDRAEEYARYSQVIHLRTPHDGMGYNKQNPLRLENSAEARVIDEKIASIWSGHPAYVEIPSTENFMLKTELTLRQILKALPENCNQCF